jgi:hypothetical protein
LKSYWKTPSLVGTLNPSIPPAIMVDNRFKNVNNDVTMNNFTEDLYTGSNHETASAYTTQIADIAMQLSYPYLLNNDENATAYQVRLFKSGCGFHLSSH